jgi:hypothetical protein
MTQANPLWGAPRIRGELLKLGIDISERTISRLMPKSRNPPSQTWRTFLDNHFRELVSIDFLTVPTATFRVLYVLVVFAHDRRRVVHFNVNEHPTAAWTAQQIIEAFPEETAPRFLLRNRDQIYGEEFRRRVAGIKIKELFDAKSLTDPSRCFKSLTAVVARKRKTLAEGERNYENQNIIRNFTDTGVGRRRLCADAGQSQTRSVF